MESKMPELELRIVEAGARSSLYATECGRLYRLYHDTHRWHGPLLPAVDARGVSRYSHNRRVSDLVARAWDAYRGVDDASSSSLPPPPQHLVFALSALAREPRDVDEFAALCGVKTSTAWGYLAKLVEHWPSAHAIARHMVHPPLLTLCKDVLCLSGSLRDVMDQLRDALSGDMEWRCLDNHYAHLRLARLCVDAERKDPAAAVDIVTGK